MKETFKKVEKFAEDLRGLGPELKAGTLENTPPHKKWKASLDALPKKDRTEYKEKIYQESRNRAWNTETILSDTDQLSFLLDDKYFNKPKNHNLKAIYKEDQQKYASEKNNKNQWLDNVEMVNLDLNSINDHSYAPKHHLNSSQGLGSFYKDGILLRFKNKKNNSTFNLILDPLISSSDHRGCTSLKLEDCNNFSQNFGCFMIQEEGNILNFNQGTTYMLSDWQDWKKEHFNNFNFPIYIMFENFSKTSAVKINLKDNIHINHVKNFFLKDNECIEKNLFEYEFPQGKPLSLYKRLLDTTGHCTASIYAMRQNNLNVGSIKQGLLKGSWGITVEHNITRVAMMLADLTKVPKEQLLETKKIVTSERGITKYGRPSLRSTLIKNAEIKNFLVDVYGLAIKASENNSVPLNYRNIMNFIEKHKKIDVTNKLFIDQIIEKKDIGALLAHYTELSQDVLDNGNPDYSTDDLTKLAKPVFDIGNVAHCLFLVITLLNHTNDGLNLPSGEIVNTENFTNADCTIYWTHTPLILLLEYFTGISVANKPPLLIDSGKVKNNIEIDGKTLNDFHEMDNTAPPMADYRGLPDKITNEIKPIINEAFDNEIYNIIWGSGAELDDEIFKYLKLFETDDHIIIFACDKRNRYLVETMEKRSKSFDGLLFNPTNHPNQEDKTLESIYLKFATLIRDIKVIIDRESNLPYQGRRQPRDLEIPLDEPMEIMTPRHRYRKRKHNGANDRFGQNPTIYKTAGFRIAHIRKLVGDAKASKEAKAKARQDPRIKNIPDGYTYVSGANWDKRQMSHREILYRNKTLTEKFYTTDAEVKKVKTIDEMSGLQFEEHSKGYLQRKKLRVDFSRNTDYGIDIIAYEKDTKVVVQCKNNRKKPVGPDIVRALVGSRDYQNSKGPVRGMIIASGGFTRGAKDEAEINKVELVSDDILNYEVE